MDFFHVLNRGVDKRCIVKDNSDRMRFMQGLYMYNDANIIDRNQRRHPTDRRVIKERDPLVYIHAFCLMDNHYHLLISPRNDEADNLSAFMRKLNMGYSKYFNERYHRNGALWQGKYKKINIEQDAHFKYIPYYIHLNPLDKKFPEWRNGKLTDQKAALTFLQTYRWSSYLDYNGIKNYPSILNTNLLKNLLGSPNKQTEEIAKITSDEQTTTLSQILEN